METFYRISGSILSLAVLVLIPLSFFSLKFIVPVIPILAALAVIYWADERRRVNEESRRGADPNPQDPRQDYGGRIV